MKNIVIIPNETKDTGLLVTKRLVALLNKEVSVYMQRAYSGRVEGAEFLDEAVLFDNADCVIVLGGDGTILRVSEPCGRKNIPVLGINLGKVGFMTEVKTDDLEASVRALLKGEYQVEKRMMMEISIVKKGKESAQFLSLNDVVIAKDNASMVLIKLYSDNEKINQYKADGLIISSPTGSTGYSLSAGGPVADPATELFIASPICAHELSARPVVLSGERELCLKLDEELGHNAIVSIDGEIREKISLGDAVIIKKSQLHTSIIKIGKQSFYDVLTEKLC